MTKKKGACLIKMSYLKRRCQSPGVVGLIFKLTDTHANPSVRLTVGELYVDANGEWHNRKFETPKQMAYDLQNKTKGHPWNQYEYEHTLYLNYSKKFDFCVLMRKSLEALAEIA